jgi:hypothetical protein
LGHEFGVREVNRLLPALKVQSNSPLTPVED